MEGKRFQIESQIAGETKDEKQKRIQEEIENFWNTGILEIKGMGCVFCLDVNQIIFKIKGSGYEIDADLERKLREGLLDVKIFYDNTFLANVDSHLDVDLSGPTMVEGSFSGPIMKLMNLQQEETLEVIEPIIMDAYSKKVLN